MRSTKKIRETLGISQQQLAVFLGIPRSLVSMYEGGRRELPTNAMTKLSQLLLSLHNNTMLSNQPALPQTHAAKDLAVMQQYKKQCCREAALTQKQLQRMKAEFQRGLQALMAVDYLFEQLPKGETSHKDQLWLELLKAKNLKKMKRCSTAQQVKLMLKEQALKHIIAASETIKF